MLPELFNEILKHVNWHDRDSLFLVCQQLMATMAEVPRLGLAARVLGKGDSAHAAAHHHLFRLMYTKEVTAANIVPVYQDCGWNELTINEAIIANPNVDYVEYLSKYYQHDPSYLRIERIAFPPYSFPPIVRTHAKHYVAPFSHLIHSIHRVMYSGLEDLVRYADNPVDAVIHDSLGVYASHTLWFLNDMGDRMFHIINTCRSLTPRVAWRKALPVLRAGFQWLDDRTKVNLADDFVVMTASDLVCYLVLLENNHPLMPMARFRAQVYRYLATDPLYAAVVMEALKTQAPDVYAQL